jgi:L-amino acid N-acyltransferase YncA
MKMMITENFPVWRDIMKIRRATPEDAEGIARVQVDSWKTTYRGIVPDNFLDQMRLDIREERWREMIPNHYAYVAETDNGEIVGFSSGGPERFGNYPGYDGELYAIYILESFQRKGLGKRLVQPIVEDLLQDNIQTMTVLVLEENHSRYFYESLGAKQIGTEEIEIGGKNLIELVYGWSNIRGVL